jgi:quinolinate synthase
MSSRIQADIENLQQQVAALKEKLNAIILVHNYQIPEIQQIADIRGDSLELSRVAAETDADVIVFCGVQFMAETAAILSPDKKVLLPVKEAGCPMADMITVDGVHKLRAEHPGAPVVCYVNSSAEVKAESDVCCTSANAIEVANSLNEDRAILVPDKHLARYVAKHTDKEIIAYQGFCPTHAMLTAEDIVKAKKEHPDAMFVAHPECRWDVLQLADHVTSTSGIFRYARESSATEFIIGTETGMLYMLHEQNPDKTFYPASDLMTCPNMKMNTLEHVIEAMEDMKFLITVEENVRERARKCLDKMLAIGAQAAQSA